MSRLKIEWREYLNLARTYQSFGFDRETIRFLLEIARQYWTEEYEHN